MRLSIRLKSYEWVLAVSFVTLAIPVLLLFLRHLDDNRLTSWQWVFSGRNTLAFLLFLVLAVLAAFFFSRPWKYGWSRPLVLFGGGFGSGALFWGAPEVIVDSARYFTQAKQFHLYGVKWFFSQWGREVFSWTDLPLVSIIYGFLFTCFGESRIVIQICTTSLFALSAVLVYLLGNLLWDEETGFNGGLFFLAIPYLYSQVPMMLADIPTMFFLLLAIYAFARALQYGELSVMGVAALSIVFAVFVKFSTWPLLSVLGVIFFLFLIRCPGDTLRRAIYVLVPASILIGVVFFLNIDVFSEQIRFLFHYQRPGLGRWTEGYVSTFFFQTHPYLTLAACASLWVAIQKKDPNYVLLFFLLALVFILQIKRSRYILPVFPILALAGGYGIQLIRDLFLRRFVILSAVTTSLVVALFAYLPFLKSMSVVNLMDGGHFIDSLPVDSVRVVTANSPGAVMDPQVNVMLLDLYTRKRISYHHPPPSRETLASVSLSPLRFTWEFNTPEYYEKDGGDALVFIDDDPGLSLAEDPLYQAGKYAHRANFTKTSGVFRHQTMVSVFWN